METKQKIDLPRVEFSANGKTERRYFIQLAGAGFDARAIELVDWQHKKKVGPLAYVVAGLKALREKKPQITARRRRAKFHRRTGFGRQRKILRRAV